MLLLFAAGVGRTQAQGKMDTDSAAIKQFVAARQPTGRFIEPENIADLILFLCGPAGRDITGAALPIDGGWMAS